MKNWRNLLPLLFALLTFGIASCQNNKVESNNVAKIKISKTETDEPVNDYLIDDLKAIRENFKRINSVQYWTEIKLVDIPESTEGGYAEFYYQGEKLEKIITRHFGETFQSLTEYYLLNGKLSFVFEKFYKYNRPIFWDLEAKEENSDIDEVFDFEKSEIIENRSYFKEDKLIHQLNNQDCGSPFAKDYLKEEHNRIKTEFEELLKMK